MRKEIWFGKEYHVEEFVNDGNGCEPCVFHGTHECEHVKCTTFERDDNMSVIFSEIEPTGIIAEAVSDDIIATVDTEHNAYSSIGWMEMAAQGQRDVQFYQGILDQIGELLGIAAYTSDDGSIQNSVVRLKLPDLVAKLVYENTLLKTKNAGLEFELREF